MHFLSLYLDNSQQLNKPFFAVWHQSGDIRPWTSFNYASYLTDILFKCVSNKVDKRKPEKFELIFLIWHKFERNTRDNSCELYVYHILGRSNTQKLKNTTKTIHHSNMSDMVDAWLFIPVLDNNWEWNTF